MNRCAVIFFALVLALVQVKATDFEKCGSPLFVPSKVTLTPDKITPGDELDLTVVGKLGSAVKSGTAHYLVEYKIGIGSFSYWQDVYEGDEDICNQMPCPMEAGKQTFHYTKDLPSIVPWGSYRITITGKDDSGKELLCFKVFFSVELSAVNQRARNWIQERLNRQEPIQT